MNSKWILKSRPVGKVEASHFEMVREPIPRPGAGEMLIAVQHLIVTPPLRMSLTSGGISGKPLPLGATVRGTGLGRVVESNNAAFAQGDLVLGAIGWQQYVISDGVRKVPVQKVVPRNGLSPTTLLHVMGASGATAWFGMYEYCRPRYGDTLVVSAAAGTVGAVMCQLGKQNGLRVIGIAGGARKCAWLTSGLNCDGAIDYKSEDVSARLRELCPRGIDIYFDNVGGAILDAALGQIAQGARVVLCGGTSQYEHDNDWYGPKNYFNLVYKQARMSGFYIYNFANRFEEAYSRLGPAFADGSLRYIEDVLDGLEQAPSALARVLSGENFGTQLARVQE